MLHTTNEYDDYIIKEVRGYQKLLDAFDISLRGKRVLDLGAHKGFFSRDALDAGAKEVVAIEPYSRNYAVLEKNAPEAKLLRGACIGWDAFRLELNRSSRMKSDAAFSVVRKKTKARKYVDTVKAWNFYDIAKRFKIQIVKMDFQGGEWGVFLKPIPKSVKVFFGEIHYGGNYAIDEDRWLCSPLKDKTSTRLILQGLINQGFKLNFWRNGKWQKQPPYGMRDRFQDVVFLR